MTTPLPPVKDDPAIQAGRTIQAAYPLALGQARALTNVTDIDRARTINRIWRQTITDLVSAAADLHQRRTDRLAALEEQLPVGTGIPNTTTPADKAVLMTAWNNAIAAAREATEEQREAMIRDAQRFGDTTTLRATLTVAVDESQWNVINRWAGANDPDTKTLFEEWQTLRTTIAGNSWDSLWEAQALGLPPQPEESKQLRNLVTTHNAGVQAFNASKATYQHPQALIQLDEGETTPGPYATAT